MGMHSRHVELVTEVDDIELDLDRAIFSRPDRQRVGLERLQARFPRRAPGCVRVEIEAFWSGAMPC